MTIVIIALQGLAGIAAGSYFIRPVIVGTAAAVTTPVFAYDPCDVGWHSSDCGCTRDDNNVKAAIGVIAASNASNSTSTSTSTGTATACTTCRMFVTAATYNGVLGGVTGADAKCASDTNKPSTGTYKAMLVDGTNRVACTTANCSGGISENVNWVLKANTAYTRTDGTAIGTTNSAAIFTTLTNAVTTSPTYNEYRTGMAFSSTPDWKAHATGHCTNYSASSGTGVCGNASSSAISTGGGTSSNFLYTNGTSCGTSVALLCVEQ